MNHWRQLREQWVGFVGGQTVPGPRPLLLSLIVHSAALGLLTLLIMSYRSAPVIVFPARPQGSQRVQIAPVSLPARATHSPLRVAQKKSTRVPKKITKSSMDSTGNGPALQALRERAKLQTAVIIQDFKFRSIYGFSTGPKYEFPIQTIGKLPAISAAELPAHFEQYVIVEVTIDTDGHVADARITTGEIAPKIAQTLLSAIREFKYRPATREGIPIPYQCDIVVHIPT